MSDHHHDAAVRRIEPITSATACPAVRTEIRGTVAAGFEPVADAFMRNFERTDERREVGAAINVMHRGRCVVDLYAGSTAQGAAAWQADTLVNVYSTTKGVVALCVALLVDRGVLRYEDRVAKIWPEFAQCGKGDTTVAHVLSHQAGLPAFDEATGLQDLFDWERCCARLAAQSPRWVAGERTGYHPITYGYLAGEIIRRASGRSAAQMIATEIATPLAADFHIGVPSSRDGQVARILAPRHMLDPATIPLPPETRLSVTNPALQPDWANLASWRRAEMPALNGHSSARALARIYSVLASGGEVAGRRFMSAAAIERMTEVQSNRIDLVLGFGVEWALGVARNGTTGFFGPTPVAVGHSGWGGSFGCADPTQQLSIGYVCNQMGPDLVGDPRARAVCDFVLDTH
jgi:CubicO group peptidase (beta-lactamase class C family)